MTLTQKNRQIAIGTPLGEDMLLLRGIKGREGISIPFSFELDMVSEFDSIEFSDIIGKNVTVSIVLEDGDIRYINGIISRFAQESGEGIMESGHQLGHYTATMVPWLWLLSRTTDSRIFQNLTGPDIVEKIFSEKGFTDFKLSLQETYNTRDYCVQYQETDLDFVSRLLEEEGIYYYFQHENGKHTMIMADSPVEHKICPGKETVRYESNLDQVILEEDVITKFDKIQEIRIGKYTVNDFNFELPSTDLKVEATSQEQIGPGERELYEFPAGYSTRADGDRLANIRMEAHEARITTITGKSTCRAFCPGYRFELTEHFRDDLNDKFYVLVSVEHEIFESIGDSGKDTGSSYENKFTCIPYEVPFRPPLLTKKPVISGVQTAIVVGPSGQEIYTDKYGRVKVQFHWDREGNRDENSSCWVRVSQAWAGPGWGGVIIPRIGHEVIIDFIEGDPDRPIITGRVYHGTNMPPYPLPDEKTKSTLKSQSTIGGGGFNEIRFEDKKGKEEIFVHAQKDMNEIILNNMSTSVGANQSISVGNDQTTTVTKNRTITIKENNDVLTVKAGTRTVTVKGDTTLTVQAGNYSATAQKGVSVHGQSKGVAIKGQGKGVIVKGTGGSGVSVSGTPNFEAQGTSQAKIKSKLVSIKGSARVDIAAPLINVGNQTVIIGGGKIILDSEGIVAIGATGSTVVQGGGGSVTLDSGGVKVNGPVIKLN